MRKTTRDMLVEGLAEDLRIFGCAYYKLSTSSRLPAGFTGPWGGIGESVGFYRVIYSSTSYEDVPWEDVVPILSLDEDGYPAIVTSRGEALSLVKLALG